MLTKEISLLGKQERRGSAFRKRALFGKASGKASGKTSLGNGGRRPGRMTFDLQENNVCEPLHSDGKGTPKDGLLKSRERSYSEPLLCLRATYSRFLATCAAGKTGNHMPLSAFGELQ